MKRHIIFDFDGTLVDGLPLIIELAREMVPDFDLSDEEIAKLRGMSARQVIQASGIPYWRLLRLLVKGKKVFATRIDELEMFKGLPEVIKRLHADGYQLSIVSSNAEPTIRAILSRYKLADYFLSIQGNVGLFSKPRAFKRLLKQAGISHHDVICVGDEVRDIESAKKAKLSIVSVTWGFNNETILAEQQPTYIVRTPQQLLQVLEGHSW